MAQPSGQVLVDSGHALAGFFAYANGTGLWDAQNGAMLTKVGSGAVTTEGGANVATSNADTYYTLASAITLSGAFSVGFRVRQTAADSRSMTVGQHTTTSSYIWLNTSGSARFGGVTIGANGGTTSMTTWHVVRDGASQPIRLYKDGVLQATQANSGSGSLIVSAILKGYSSNTSFDFAGALEWVHVLPAGKVLNQTEIDSLVADPYQMLQAPVGVTADVAGFGAMSWAGTGAVDATDTPPITVAAAGFGAMSWTAAGAAEATITSGTIALTAPAAYRMHQRNVSTGTASVTISGTYTGSPSSIQYRFAGGAWQTLVASPSGGTFSQAVTLSTGQGAIEVRFGNDTAVTASRALVGVGDIYATPGQSNNVGAATSVVAPVATNFTPVEYLGGAWVPLREGLTTGDSYSGLSGYGGSYFGALANRLQADGIPVAFVPCAQGSTTIANWQKGQSLYNTMISRITAVGGVRAVIFWLGESDANNGTTQAAFETGLGQMVNDIHTDTGCKTFINKIVRWIPAADTIRAAQDAVIAGNANVAGYADCDVYAASGVHYLTTTDINNVADAVYAPFSATFYPDPLTADVAGAGAMTWTATGDSSAVVSDPPVTADVAGFGAMSWAADGASSVTLLAAVAADVQGAAAMAWAATGSAYSSDGWPTAAAGPSHRAIVPFNGVRAIVNAESIES